MALSLCPYGNGGGEMTPEGFVLAECKYPNETPFFEIFYRGTKIGSAIKDGDLWYTIRLPKRRDLVDLCKAIIKSELKQAEDEVRMKKYLLNRFKENGL